MKRRPGVRWRVVAVRIVVLGLACSVATAAEPAPTRPAAPSYPIPVPTSAPDERGALPLYPDQAATRPENWVKFGEDYAVRNVTRPTLTPVLPPAGRATGAAVIVAPGGAFMLLAMSLEGWTVAQALADRGIAAFVLKYRLNETPADEQAFGAFAAARMAGTANLGPDAPMPEIREPRAVEDALAALRLVRANAARWGVDPARIGMMGFSAGAMTTLNAALAREAAVRPAFIAPIYPPMLEVEVPADAPPMFVAMALDDELFGRQGFGLIDSWHRAGRPVEFHAYERGGHGFGTGRPGTTSTLMLEQFVAWLRARGVVGEVASGAPPGARR